MVTVFARKCETGCLYCASTDCCRAFKGRGDTTRNLKTGDELLLLASSLAAQIFEKEILELDHHRRAGVDLQR